MLNSAAGLQFPNPIAPPIIVISLILFLISGNAFKRIAILVNDPVATNSIFYGWAMILLYIVKKGFSSIASCGDFSSSAPYNPEGPWIEGEIFNCLESGHEEPLIT